MRNFARLVLNFSLSFIIIFLIATGARFLSLRVEWTKILPPKPETVLTLIITAAHWALSLALFSSILFSLGFAVRMKFFAPMAVICVMILSAAFTFGISFVLEQWKSVPPAQTAGIQLGDKGLILSNSLNRNETAVILLNGTSDPLGPRVTSVPGQPLVFQEAVFAAGTSYDLPPVPFGDNTPWFLKDLSIDIRLNAELFQKKFIEGIIPFFIYVCPLIFMLCSLGYAIKFSAWPLANFFLGILAFRGILALETFFNSPEMQEIISSFLRNAIPVSFAVPLIFCIFGLLVCLYSVLVFIVRRRLDNDD